MLKDKKGPSWFFAAAFRPSLPGKFPYRQFLPHSPRKLRLAFINFSKARIPPPRIPSHDIHGSRWGRGMYTETNE